MEKLIVFPNNSFAHLTGSPFHRNLILPAESKGREDLSLGSPRVTSDFHNTAYWVTFSSQKVTFRPVSTNLYPVSHTSQPFEYFLVYSRFNPNEIRKAVVRCKKTRKVLAAEFWSFNGKDKGDSVPV